MTTQATLFLRRAKITSKLKKADPHKFYRLTVVFKTIEPMDLMALTRTYAPILNTMLKINGYKGQVSVSWRQSSGAAQEEVLISVEDEGKLPRLRNPAGFGERAPALRG